MIYLIGAMPGMRKSTIITPCFRAQKPIYHNSTDIIRASTSHLLRRMGYEPREKITTPSVKFEGEDAPAWVGTIGLIRFLNRNRIDALIEGVAILPEGVRNLELEDPSLEIRAAFVGYSKIMEFQAPEWTPKLENLVETAIGKDYLENFAKKHNWIYEKIKPHDELDRSEREFKNPAKKLGRPNFRYFDLIDFIPPERRGGEVAKLQLEDHIKMAAEVRSFLLFDPTETGQLTPLPAHKRP